MKQHQGSGEAKDQMLHEHNEKDSNEPPNITEQTNDGKNYEETSNDELLKATLGLQQYFDVILGEPLDPTVSIIDQNSDGKVLENRVTNVLNCLENIGIKPKPRMGNGDPILEAYNILTFALLEMRKLEKFKREDTISDFAFSSSEEVGKLKEEVETLKVINEELRAQITDLNSQLSSNLNTTETVMSSIINKYSLPPDTTLQTLSRNLDLSSTFTINSSTEINAFNNDANKNNKYFINKHAQNSECSALQEEVLELKRTNESLKRKIVNIDEEMLTKNNKIKNLMSDNRSLALMLKYQTNKSDELSRKLSLETHPEALHGEGRIFALEAEVESLKIELFACQSQSTKRREKIDKLRNALKASTQALKDVKNMADAQNMEYQKLRTEYEELRSIPHKASVISPNCTLEQQNTDLINAMEMVASQITVLNEDINTETKTRDKLIQVVQRQMSLINQLESVLKDRDDTISRMNEHEKSLLSDIKRLKESSSISEFQGDALIASLTQNISSIDSKQMSDKLLSILLDQKLPYIDRINELIAKLIAFTKDSKHLPDKLDDEPNLSDENLFPVKNTDMESLNDRLFGHILSLNHFISMIASSEDIKSWYVLGDTDVTDRLRHQMRLTSNFIKENAESLVHESPLVSSFFFAADPFEMPKQFDALKSRLQKVQDPTVRELLAILESSVLANDVLRTYSQAVKSQCELKALEALKLKNEISDLQSECEGQRSEFNQKIEASKQKMNRYSKAFTNMKDVIEDCIKDNIFIPRELASIIEPMIGIKIPDEGELVHCVRGNSPEIFDNGGAKKSKMRRLQEEIDELKVQMSRLTHENQELQRSHEESITEAQEMLDDAKKKNQKLEEDIIKLKKCNSDFIKEVNETSRLSDDNKSKVISELESKVMCLSTQLKDCENRAAMEIKLAKEKMENEVKVCKRDARKQLKVALADLDKQARIVEGIRNHYEPILDDLRQKLVETRENETNLIKENDKLENQLRESKSRVSSLELDIKMITMKLQTTEERSQRELGIAASQLKMQHLSDVATAQSQVEKAKSEAEEKVRRFIAQTANSFRPYVDVDNTDDDSVVLEQASKDLATLRNQEVKYRVTLGESDAIRELLNISSGTNLRTAIEEYVSKFKIMKQENDDLKKEMTVNRECMMEARALKSLAISGKEWDAWARKVASGLSDVVVASKSSRELRFSIEEAVSACSSMSIVSRLESLRIQKAILVSGLSTRKHKNYKPNMLRTIIIISASIHRMQRNSGHLQTALSMPFSPVNCKCNGSMNLTQAKNITTGNKKWALISSG